MKKVFKFKLNNSNKSTIFGAIVAVATAWVTVDWETFTFDFKHIAPLVLSGLVALGGYMTSINSKNGKTKSTEQNSE